MKKIILFVGLFFYQIVLCSGSIILLNGVSSAGKSSISKCLHEMIDNSVIVGLDDLFWSHMIRTAESMGLALPEMSYEQKYCIAKKHKPEVVKKLRNNREQTTKQELFCNARTLALQGKIVILDTPVGIFSNDEWVMFWNKVEKIQVLSVLVYCPFSENINHVVARNYSGIFDQERRVKAVVEQFIALYILSRSPDLMIDVLQRADVDCAFEKVLAELQRKFDEKEVKKIFKKLLQKFEKKFQMNQLDKVSIGSKLNYDLLVNTAEHSSYECALQIYSKLYS